MATRLAQYGVPAALCAAWSMLAGKDLNWDLLHYHYYVAHSLLSGRSAQDFFAAGGQSYVNPIGFMPFYLMVSAGWYSAAVSAILAALHGVSLALLFEICWTLFGHRPPGQRAVLSVLATAVGAASAVFWATIGTSFLDPLLLVPMLGGVVLVVRARPAESLRASAYAGVLFGIAAALKYSNAFYALAGTLLCLTIPALSWPQRLRAVGAYAAGGALAVLALAGPWLLHLGREFGNPFFPLLNAVFRSPDAPPYMLAGDRFAPQDLAEALALPFRMARSESMIYAEISAPDLRLAALALACLPLLLPRVRSQAGVAFAGVDFRLLAFFASCLAAWLVTSGNARYGMLVLLLVGPCLARVLERWLPARFAILALVLALAGQLFACIAVSPARWFLAEPWTERWLPFEVPERARAEAAVYLTIEPQSMSAVVPFLHPGSSFASLRGQPSQGSDRLGRLLRDGSRPLRALGRGLRLQSDGRPRPEAIEEYDAKLVRFGLRLDTTDCFPIAWRGERGPVLSLASCALARAQRDPRESAAESRASAVFDRVERGCQGLLRGQRSVTERFGAEWERSYPALEARLETRAGRVILVPWFKLSYLDLGSIAAWEGDATALAAGCRDSRIPR